MKAAIVLAGGRGTRLGDGLPPKAMIDVNGKTLLQRQLEWLAREGFDAVVLSLGYRAGEVSWEAPEGCMVKRSVEGEPLGTAGAVKRAYGAGALKGSVYVLNVDDLVEVDTGAAFERAESAPVVVVKPLPFSCVDKDGVFSVQKTFDVHVGHHVLREEDVKGLPEKGDLPQWLAGRRIVPHRTRAEWVSVNTPAQADEARRRNE